MSTQYDAETDLSEPTQEQLVTFARTARVDAQYRRGGALNNAMTIANMEMLDMLVLDDGMVTNPENTLAFIFDPEAIPERFLTNHEKLTEPARRVSEETWINDSITAAKPYALFEFSNGNATAIQMALLQTVEEVYGFNPMEHPRWIESHPEQNGWPIRIRNPFEQTAILAAPLEIDY
jgi:hypothetical protein